MTKEQFTKLSQYEIHLKTAKKGFVHGISRLQMTELNTIAEQLNIKTGSVSCPKCCYNTVSALSKLYYEYIDSKAIIKDSSTNLSTEDKSSPDETKTASKPVKKAGRPAKKAQQA